jgi:hypothetical protein
MNLIFTDRRTFIDLITFLSGWLLWNRKSKKLEKLHMRNADLAFVFDTR